MTLWYLVPAPYSGLQSQTEVLSRLSDVESTPHSGSGPFAARHIAMIARDVSTPCFGCSSLGPDHWLTAVQDMPAPSRNRLPLICRSHVQEAGPEPDPDVARLGDWTKIRFLTIILIIHGITVPGQQCPALLLSLLDHHTSVGNPPFKPNSHPLVIFGSPNFLKQRYNLLVSPRVPRTLKWLDRHHKSPRQLEFFTTGVP